MRIRQIKPEFWEDEDLSELSRDVRLLFLGLLNMAEREGKIKGTARFIKGKLFPYDDDVTTETIEGWLNLLADHRKHFIVRYEVDGEQYILIPKFVKHQRFDPREQPKGYPSPPSHHTPVIEPVLEEQCLDTVKHAPDIQPVGPDKGTGLTGSTENGSSCRRMLRSTDEQKAIAVWMEERIREINPTAKPPNIESWANEVRLMVEQDERSLDAIKELFSWANKDQFWRTNILSPGKLREKWDQLQAKRLNPVQSRPPQAGTKVDPRQIVMAEHRQERSGRIL